MKTLKSVTCAVLIAGMMVAPATVFSAENKKDVKPYPLQTCLVTGEKLDAMGQPYVFTYKGQEIKLCCKSCLKTFNKEPAKYIKKLEEGQKSK